MTHSAVLAFSITALFAVLTIGGSPTMKSAPTFGDLWFLLVFLTGSIAAATIDIRQAIREGHHANPDLAPRTPCTPEQHRARFGDPRSD